MRRQGCRLVRFFPRELLGLTPLDLKVIRLLFISGLIFWALPIWAYPIIATGRVLTYMTVTLTFWDGLWILALLGYLLFEALILVRSIFRTL